MCYFGKDSNITDKTKTILQSYSDEEIQEACEILGKIGIFIKNSK